jgi:hypothetical protein
MISIAGLKDILSYFVQTFQPHYGPEVDSAHNRNKYRNLPGGKGRPRRKAELTALYETIV